MRRLLFLTIVLFFAIPLIAEKQTFENGTTFQVAFSLKGECTSIIVKVIDDAKKSILVQGYSFTSAPIAKALVNAYKREIDVKVILNKSHGELFVG